MSSPLISVLVPVYNCDAFIEQTLESLLSQSFYDFEAIICDDASSDSSLELTNKIAAQDPRIKVFAHDNNVGMTNNWNRALNYARGQYVMKLDADDAFANDTLQSLVNAITSKPCIAALCRTIECDDKLNPVTTYRGEQALTQAGIDPSIDCRKSAGEWYQLAFNDRQLWHSNAFILETKRLRQMSGWDEQFGCASDTDLILRILEQEGEIAHVSYQGVLYRMREGSISDGFRKNDALIDENYIVALRSLNRAWSSGRVLNRTAKLNWYRLWQNANERSNKVRELPADILTLPASVRLLGMIQRALYTIKQRVVTNPN